MSYAEHLWALLAPLGPYRPGSVYLARELESEGAALDKVAEALDELEREALLDTAESWGLARWEGLLTRPPVAGTVQGRRQALAALLRIGGDSFTLAAVNDNLKGCGINAVVDETGERDVVEVRFPDVPGIPDGFAQLRKIIEDILPCHLQVNYLFWYITWRMAQARFSTWGDIDGGYTWEELEKLVT